MKKKYIIAIITVLIIIIPIAGFAISKVTKYLYIPEEEEKERTLTYHQNSEVATLSDNEEDDMMKEKTAIIEESQKNQEKAIEILKKYNNNFEKVYEEVIEINKIKNYGPRDLEEKEIELYNIILDVYESKKITEEEKVILKKLIEEGYCYMKKDSNLKIRADKILNN